VEELNQDNQGLVLCWHDWSAGFRERLGWLTDVLESADRTEQRVRLRSRPRRRWDLQLAATGAERMRLENILAGRTVRHCLFPVWPDAAPLTVAVSAGGAAFSCQTTGRDYVVGGELAMFAAGGKHEIRTVSTLGPDGGTVTAPFAEDWPAGTMCAPLRDCLFVEGRRLNRWTPDYAEYAITAEVLGAARDLPALSPELWLDHPLCPFPAGWAEAEEGVTNKWVVLDNATGPLEFMVEAVEPVLSRSAEFLLDGRAQIAEFLSWLHLLAGRLTPFWLPADGHAFSLVATAPAGAQTIVVASQDYTRSLAGSPARSHLEIETASGAVIRRKIIGSLLIGAGDTEELTLDAPLPDGLAESQIRRANWLELVRLASDEIELQWLSDEAVSVTLPVVALP